MADIFSKSKRSEIMSKIRRVSSIERSFAKRLSEKIYPMGYRYRLNYKKVPGSPDIAFVAQKFAIFIDGDFWHGYKFKERRKKLPKLYWRDKIAANIRRDRKNRLLLRRMGWRHMRIWEHEIMDDPQKKIREIMEHL
jgi:DNA mismatch endonuclease (patch repair protein)